MSLLLVGSVPVFVAIFGIHQTLGQWPEYPQYSMRAKLDARSSVHRCDEPASCEGVIYMLMGKLWGDEELHVSR